MNGRTFPLPAVLALSVASTVGSGAFAPVSYSEENTPPAGYTSSWSCSAPIHQDWRCSAEAQKAYSENLEQIAQKRSTLRGSFAYLVHEALEKSRKYNRQKQMLASKDRSEKDKAAVTQSETSRPVSPEPAEEQIAQNTQQGLNQQAPKKPKAMASARPAPQKSPAKKQPEQQLPETSLADNDWVSRLQTRSSWPEDQRHMPKREIYKRPGSASDGNITEEELGRSVLLSKWLERAKRSTYGTRKGRRPEQTDKPEKVAEQPLYTDSVLNDAQIKASQPEQRITPPEQKTAAQDQKAETVAKKEPEQSSSLELISSITLEPKKNAAKTPNRVPDEFTLTQAEQLATPETTPNLAASKALQSKQPKGQQAGVAQPPRSNTFGLNGLRRSLLEHQATAPSGMDPGNAPLSIPPRSVMSAQKNMPAFQIQLAKRAEFTPAAPVTPPPRTRQPQWLPDLEVTPAERLAKARPKPNSLQRQVPHWKKKVTPDQWQHAPSGTPLPYPKTGQPQYTFTDSRDIRLPDEPESSASLPPAQHTEMADSRNNQTSWSLTGQTLARASKPVYTPIDNQIKEQEPILTPWPDGNYKASGRLAPSIPGYQGKPKWPDSRNQQTLKKVQTRSKIQGINQYRRPPPVSPEDIYQVTTQEPPSAGKKQSQLRRQAPMHRDGQNSADRLRIKAREATSSLPEEQPYMPVFTPEKKAAPKVKPDSWPASHYGLQQTRLHEKVRPAPRSLEELLSKPGNSVTIQWLMTRNPERITALQKRYPVLKSATTVSFHSQGKVWHLLISGIYATASDAVSLLSTDDYRPLVSKLRPWPRPIAGIRKLKLVSTKELSTTQNSKPLPQGEYTIEWSNADNPDTLMNLRSRYTQLADAEIVMVTRGRKTQYFLIQGRFPDNAKAKAALTTSKLKALSRQLSPRTRPMASLKHKTKLSYKPIIT